VSRKRKVAILGAGMAGMAAAWRLSEPGWHDEFASITVYQRGWRLGGKGASHRGRSGRIEEHGLHLWLGYYENAFRVLRECYEELDRPVTDPDARIRSWRDAMLPTAEVGLEDFDAAGWHHWVGTFTRNDELPGEPEAVASEFTLTDFAGHALRLVADFLESLPDLTSPSNGVVALSASARPHVDDSNAIASGAPIVVLAAILEALTQLHAAATRYDDDDLISTLDRALTDIRTALQGVARDDADARRTWHLVSVMVACVRGVLADQLLARPEGFRAINDEDFLDWIVRHGAAEEVGEFAFIRGLYDLVFADAGAGRSRSGVSAGVAVFMTSKMFFEYKGAIFWKMAAGMGDVVFAPMYQALRRRGVEFEFFHRLDDLEMSTDGLNIERIVMGRQVALRPGVERYEPLVRVGDLPTFPAVPLVDQLHDAHELEGHDLESHWCDWPDVERRCLRRGEEFDVAVFGIPIAMAEEVCKQLIADRPEWKAMVSNVATTATQALQLWLRRDEPELGWQFPGATVSAFAQPFNTWASMDQLIDAECWPDDERPGAIGYFCGALDAPWPPSEHDSEYAAREHRVVVNNALRFVTQDLPHLLPGLAGAAGLRWELFCATGGEEGVDALATQYVRANVDPSDRYVQCVPGSDQFRLRSDESGFDNLFLAGDWTDNGLNAGCIEAATLSGLQAANAILGRSRRHRIAGRYML
jgi:uncharacterized protein with NAD-binding domain and iron-sulfur cluster